MKKRIWTKPKGHWPRGRRRNPSPGVLIIRLRRALRHIEPGRVSRRALADYLGVSVRTVCRWLAGIDWPSPAYHDIIRRWLDERPH